jgi:thioredoxin-like negative regulator of GroEL
MRCVFFVAAVLLAASSAQRGRGQQQQQPKKPVLDPYAVLGVAKDATLPAIRAAYRILSLKYHPDKNKAEDSKQRMADVSNAYELIADPDKKVIFDEFGTEEKYYTKWQYERSQRMKGKEVSTKGFYAESVDVATLSLKNFYQETKGSKGMLVEFYAPWCVHCQDMVGEYKKAGILLEDIMPLGAVNCEQEKKLCKQQNIQAFPTMVMYSPVSEKAGAEGAQQQATEEYSGGEHTADAIYSFVQQSLSTALVELTDTTFDEQVYGGDGIWLVDFTAGAWCGPCTQLRPSVRKTAAELEGFAKVGVLNCDTYKETCARLGVNFYPQLRVFKTGKTSSSGDTLDTPHRNPALNALGLFSVLVKLTTDPPRVVDDEEAMIDHHGEL